MICCLRAGLCPSAALWPPVPAAVPAVGVVGGNSLLLAVPDIGELNLSEASGARDGELPGEYIVNSPAEWKQKFIMIWEDYKQNTFQDLHHHLSKIRKIKIRTLIYNFIQISASETEYPINSWERDQLPWCAITSMVQVQNNHRFIWKACKYSCKWQNNKIAQSIRDTTLVLVLSNLGEARLGGEGCIHHRSKQTWSSLLVQVIQHQFHHRHTTSDIKTLQYFYFGSDTQYYLPNTLEIITHVSYWQV